MGRPTRKALGDTCRPSRATASRGTSRMKGHWVKGCLRVLTSTLALAAVGKLLANLSLTALGVLAVVVNLIAIPMWSRR
jgi:hypothetical protein